MDKLHHSLPPEAIQERLSSINCPVCQASGLMFIPRGEAGFADMLYKVRCSKCPYLFPLNVPTRPIEQIDPDIGQWLQGLCCPACQQRGAQHDFRCTPTVRLSVYFLTCKHCGHHYHESAPMEAYE
jgi:rubredoxin